MRKPKVVHGKDLKVTLNGKEIPFAEVEYNLQPRLRYNRAFIKHDENSSPLLEALLKSSGMEDQDALEYWLIDSRESFHGEYDSQFFYFKDSRLDYGCKLPLACVELEFTEEELDEQF